MRIRDEEKVLQNLKRQTQKPALPRGTDKGPVLASVHHLTQQGEAPDPGATVSRAAARALRGLKQRPTGGTPTPCVLEMGPEGVCGSERCSPTPKTAGMPGGSSPGLAPGSEWFRRAGF